MEGDIQGQDLQSMTLGEDFSESLDGMTLPSGFRSLIFGYRFDHSLENVTLPDSLEDLALLGIKDPGGQFQSTTPSFMRTTMESCIHVLELKLLLHICIRMSVRTTTDCSSLQVLSACGKFSIVCPGKLSR